MKLHSSDWSRPNLQLHTRTMSDSIEVPHGKPGQGKNVTNTLPVFTLEVSTDPMIYYQVPGEPGEYEGHQPMHVQITSNTSELNLDEVRWRLSCQVDSLRSALDVFSLDQFLLRVAGQGDFMPANQPLVLVEQVGMTNPELVDVEVKFLVSLDDMAGDYTGQIAFNVELLDEDPP